MEIAHEPGPNAYQEHEMDKVLVHEVADELCTSCAGSTVPPAARGGGLRHWRGKCGPHIANRGWLQLIDITCDVDISMDYCAALTKVYLHSGTFRG